MTSSYCTILAQNYLPRAMSLSESLERHHPGHPLVVLLIDVASDEDLPDLPGAPAVRLVSTEVLGLSRREVLDLAAGYDLVEYATAVKPLLLKALLADTDQAVYLDPDTWLVAPMEELEGAVTASEGGIVLTPHYLEPIVGEGLGTEGHLLSVGVFNLGFCAVDRRALGFLDWWWSHLRSECLADPLHGLFVDQKWADIGNTLFRAGTLRHYGYNVGVMNLHERPVEADAEGYVIAGTGDRLRLFHFHAFDPHRPEELSTRFRSSTAHLRASSPVLDELCREYAQHMLRHLESLPPAPPYPYFHDTEGRRVSRPLRRVHRRHVREGRAVPSPFLPEEAPEWSRWRRRARKEALRDALGDVATAVRVLAPEESKRLKSRFPRLTGRVRERYVEDSGWWG